MTRLHTPTRLPSALGGERAVSVAAEVNHNLALTAGGAVWSWGGGGSGKLGHGDGQAQPLPKKIEAFADRRVVSLSGGAFHSIALTADGAVFTWGDGRHGCLGQGEDLSNQLLPKKIEVGAEEGMLREKRTLSRPC